MRQRWLFALLCLLSMVGCGRSSTTAQQFRYHDNGKAKPSVALVSIFDQSHSDVNWDLSEEFTSGVKEHLIGSSDLYLTSDFEMLSNYSLSSIGLHPFFEDLNWLYEAKNQTEFVVFAEIIDHSLTPVANAGTISKTFRDPYQLKIAIRVRVVDLRGERPKVILQEIFQEDEVISWKFSSREYGREGFKKSAFFLSPLGRVHARMMKSISRQIHDYIILAKAH